MTSKERVRAAAARKPSDRIPAAFEAVSTVVQRLLREYGFSNIEQLYNRFNIDTRYLSPAYVGPPLKQYVNAAGKEIKQNFWGFEEEYHKFGEEEYATTCYFPFSGVETMEQARALNFPDPGWFDYDAMRRECEKHVDKAIVIGHEGPFQIITFLMNMEEFFILMMDRPDVAKYILDKTLDFELEYYERTFKACGGLVDILRPHDDYGTQISLLFGVDMWREFFRENTIKLTSLAHKYGVFYQQHSCGAISQLIPEFIECGVDILEPLQKLEGLEPEIIAAKYGDYLTFHGGIDTQELLPRGTVEEVRAEALRYMQALGGNGGYILMASQNFENDVPTANIQAVYDADRSV